MSRRVTIRRLCALLICGVVVALLSPSARAQAPAPTCQTLDARDAAAAAFAPGDVVTVKGAGFAPRSPVSVDYVQGAVSSRLASVDSDDKGSFSTKAEVTTVPPDASGGTATLRADDGSMVATCSIQVITDGPLPVPSRNKVLLAVWLAVLVAFGTCLGSIGWRRWRTSRLDASLTSTTREARTVLDVSGVPYLNTTDWEPADEDQDFEAEATPDDVSPTVARLLADTKEWADR